MVHNNIILLFVVINDFDNACARDYSMGGPLCKQLPKIIVIVYAVEWPPVGVRDTDD